MEENKKEFGLILSEKLDMENISAALPKDFNKSRFVQNCIAYLNDNAATYKKYSQTAIMAGLMKGAFLGLDIINQECYLIPYGDRLNFQASYKGMVKLAKKYSTRKIKSIASKIIRDGDVFEETIVNGVQSFTFTPKPLNSGEIIGAFAFVMYEDGTVEYDVMNREELENTRKHSKAANSGAWRDFYSEMCRKTVIRRLCKYIELEFESPEMKATYDEEAAIETDPVKENEIIVEAEANTVDFEEFDTDESGDPK